jgi:hypothetical protein
MLTKKFIEWSEGDINRGRKAVLFSTILMFILITLGVFGRLIAGYELPQDGTSMFGILVGFMVGIYGFYTGTRPSRAGDENYSVDYNDYESIDHADTTK